MILSLLWQEKAAELPFHCVIRPGCYLIHDTGIYQQAQDKISRRSQAAQTIMGELRSSLFIWAYVLSLQSLVGRLLAWANAMWRLMRGYQPLSGLTLRQQQLHKVDDADTYFIMDQHAVMIKGLGSKLVTCCVFPPHTHV